MMHDLDRDGFSWIVPGVALALVVTFFAYFWFGRSPPAPLPNSTVYGCYEAQDSPSIRLDASGMQILQSDFPRIGFHLELHKTGYDLTADAPIRADWTGSGYRYSIERRGIGWFLPFYRIEGDKTYGVFEPSLLSGFQMLANDGNSLNYTPIDDAKCVKTE